MKIIVFEVVCLERKMLGVKCRICGNEKDNVKYVIKERILNTGGGISAIFYAAVARFFN